MLVYVAHHRAGPHAGDHAGYRAVCNVDAAGARPIGFNYYDDQGGYPQVNAAYCELSVLRKIQTDHADDVVGLTHYRRIFVNAPSTGFKDAEWGIRTLASFDWANPGDVSADIGSLQSRARGADWITADAIDITGRGFRNLRKQFEVSHDARLLAAADARVADLFPGQVGLYEYLEGRRRIRPFNMFLGSWTALDAYASSLWLLLDAMPARTYSSAFQQRWPGFIAERFFSYWSDVIAPTLRLTVASMPIVLLDGCTVQNSEMGQSEELGQRSLARRLDRAAMVALGLHKRSGARR